MLRARKPAAKSERRAAISDAANELLIVGEYVLPSAASIAAKAGLAKGTLYLYFKTKEAIYLALLGEGYARWAECVAEGLTGEWPKVGPFLKRYIAFCNENPKMMMLGCMGPAVLEPKVDEEAAFAYKKGIEKSTREISALLSVGFPPLSVAQARQIYPTMQFVTLAFWQQTHPPPAVQRAVDREDLMPSQLNFEGDLYTALEALWQGFRGRRSS